MLQMDPAGSALPIAAEGEVREERVGRSQLGGKARKQAISQVILGALKKLKSGRK